MLLLLLKISIENLSRWDVEHRERESFSRGDDVCVRARVRVYVCNVKSEQQDKEIHLH